MDSEQLRLKAEIVYQTRFENRNVLLKGGFRGRIVGISEYNHYEITIFKIIIEPYTKNNIIYEVRNTDIIGIEFKGEK